LIRYNQFLGRASPASADIIINSVQHVGGAMSTPDEKCTVKEQDLKERGLSSEVTGTLKLSGIPICTLTVTGSNASLKLNLSEIGTIRTEKGMLGGKKLAIYGRRRNRGNTGYDLVSWHIERLGSPDEWASRISEERKRANDFDYNINKGKDLVVRKLRSREQMTFDEIKEVWLSLVPEGTVDLPGTEVIDFLERRINDGDIEGFVDVQRKEFVHAKAHRQTTEVIQYNIATSFDFADGMLKIKCPSCGSPNIQKVKANESKCVHCGSTYVIPNKILDML
jgi:hypothetical protein